MALKHCSEWVVITESTCPHCNMENSDYDDLYEGDAVRCNYCKKKYKLVEQD